MIIYGPLIKQKLEKIKQARQVIIEQARLARGKAEQLRLAKLAEQEKLDETTRQQDLIAKQAAALLEKRKEAKRRQELLATQAADRLKGQQRKEKELEIELASLEPPEIPISGSPLDDANAGGEVDADVQTVSPTEPDLTIAIQSELGRLGCLKSGANPTWNKKSRAALAKYLAAAKAKNLGNNPTERQLAKLRSEKNPTLCKIIRRPQPTITQSNVKPTGRKIDKDRGRKIVKPPKNPVGAIIVRSAPRPTPPKPPVQVARKKTKRCITWIGIAIIVKPC